MKTLYFYPQYKKGTASNPYCDNFLNELRKSFKIIPRSKCAMPRGVEFFKGSIFADICVVNWLEDVGTMKFGQIQFLFTLMALVAIKIRRTKLVWIFHNIHPK